LSDNNVAVPYFPRPESVILRLRIGPKGKNRSKISLKGFLREIQECPQLISREHYMSLYKGAEAFLVDMGKRDFDRVAGEGSPWIPLSLVDQQLEEMKQRVSKLEGFADRRIAHYDRREPARPLPTFTDLTEAIQHLEKIVILYWRLLKDSSLSTLSPTIIFDWKDVFRFAWQPQEREGRARSGELD
jgi:hypothetical protein